MLSSKLSFYLEMEINLYFFLNSVSKRQLWDVLRFVPSYCDKCSNKNSPKISNFWNLAINCSTFLFLKSKYVFSWSKRALTSGYKQIQLLIQDWIQSYHTFSSVLSHLLLWKSNKPFRINWDLLFSVAGCLDSQVDVVLIQPRVEVPKMLFRSHNWKTQTVLFEIKYSCCWQVSVRSITLSDSPKQPFGEMLLSCKQSL